MTVSLAIDVSNLCYRSFHAFNSNKNKLSFRDRPTGVLFGFFRDLIQMSEFHRTDSFVFCFDSKTSVRRELFSEYKIKRIESYEKSTKAEKRALGELREQVRLLKDEYLPRLGYGNIYHYEGYEADDLLAAYSHVTFPEEVLLVSSDKDLYSVLDPRVQIYDIFQKRTLSSQWFFSKYNLHPKEWVQLKALMGDPSDSIPGVPGIGIKTAQKYLSGTLDANTSAMETIGNHWKKYKLYQKLVRIPFDLSVAEQIKVHADSFTVKAWKTLCEELGFHSLMNTPPILNPFRSIKKKDYKYGK